MHIFENKKKTFFSWCEWVRNFWNLKILKLKNESLILLKVQSPYMILDIGKIMIYDKFPCVKKVLSIFSATKRVKEI